MEILNKSLRTRFIFTFFVTMLISGVLTSVFAAFFISTRLHTLINNNQQQIAQAIIAAADEYSGNDEDSILEFASAGLYRVSRLDADNAKVIKYRERLDNGEIVFDGIFSLPVSSTIFRADGYYYEISIFPNSSVVIAIILAIAFTMAVTISVGTFIAGFTSKSFLRPIREIGSATSRIADGDFSVRVSSPKNRELRELVDNFNSMTASLGATESLQKDFINNVSHEFKTPLASIGGFAEILGGEGLTDEERREYASIIYDETRRLSKLSSNILSLSKLDNPSAVMQTESYSLDEQLRRALLNLEPRWRAKGIEPEVSLDRVDIKGSRELCMQVWTNLLDNAVKFCDQGGKIRLELIKEGSFAVVTVGNTGAYIPPDDLERVFDKFWQGDRSRSADGNGLGLSLCRKIVELSGGSIAVCSAEGGETVFTVRLPVDSAQK